MALTDQELREVLARAEEIQRSLHPDTDLPALIAAAEEVGISRQAMERALRERMDLALTPPAVGSLVFARSANDKFYAAEVIAVGADGVRVRYLRGSEHVVEPDQVRPASLIPGERIIVDWPWWGPWTCSVISFDAARERVKVSDGWGSTRSFPLAEVWLPASRKADERGRNRRRVYATLLGVGAVLGALLGAAATLLLK